MNTVIIDYGLGNLGSIRNMLRRIGADASLSSSERDIAAADRLILGGVGTFDVGMKNLLDRNLVSILRRRVLEQRTPILGICLGLQLFGTDSEEGHEPGLGWIDARSVRFQAPPRGPKRVPHMGWNTFRARKACPLLNALEDDSRFYFVHSYHLECRDDRDVAAITQYGYDFPSVIVRGNVMGTQFHPEKSHRFGLQLMSNFVQMPLC